jgi:hypothetical protein
MVVAGIFVGARPRGYTRAFWRPDRSVGFTLRLLLALCILYGTVWALHAAWRAP